MNPDLDWPTLMVDPEQLARRLLNRTTFGRGSTPTLKGLTTTIEVWLFSQERPGITEEEEEEAYSAQTTATELIDAITSLAAVPEDLDPIKLLPIVRAHFDRLLAGCLPAAQARLDATRCAGPGEKTAGGEVVAFSAPGGAP